MTGRLRAVGARRGEMPVGVVGRGLASGVAATALISVLGRLAAVLLRSTVPAAVEAGNGRSAGGAVIPMAVSPAAVLAQAEGPGPEEAAAQFARKVMAGLFGRDISQWAGVAGEVVHFTYGGLWGALYGLVQSSYAPRPGPFGLLFGLVVWLIGPGWLVPAMHLMAPPAREPRLRLAVMVAGHLIYGLAVARTYRGLATGR